MKKRRIIQIIIYSGEENNVDKEKEQIYVQKVNNLNYINSECQKEQNFDDSDIQDNNKINIRF